MGKAIKSGKEILDDFFSEIRTVKDVDRNIVDILEELYNQDKISDTNIINRLDELREKNKE